MIEETRNKINLELRKALYLIDIIDGDKHEYPDYDKELTEEQLEYGYLNHISYNQIPAISKIDEYISCPPDFSNASFAYKIPDDAMEPMFKEGSYAFVEINAPIENRAVGLFKLNGDYFIRRLLYKKDRFILRADHREERDMTVTPKDDFQIIGRVYI